MRVPLTCLCSVSLGELCAEPRNRNFTQLVFGLSLLQLGVSWPDASHHESPREEDGRTCNVGPTGIRTFWGVACMVGKLPDVLTIPGLGKVLRIGAIIPQHSDLLHLQIHCIEMVVQNGNAEVEAQSGCRNQ